MSIQTTNYGFTKPTTDEFYDVEVQNGNWDKADTKFKEQSTQLSDMEKEIKTIDGRNAIATDANNCGIVGQKTVYRTNADTLNTPYKVGLTGGNVGGLVETYLTSTLNGIQIGYSSGKNIMTMREFSNGIWADWKQMTINDTGWIQFTLLNGILHFSAGSELFYRKIDNRVYIKGAVKNITSLSTIIANLPNGFRPTGLTPFAIPATNKFNKFSISMDGNITFDYTTFTGTLASTDWYPINASFLID